MKRMLIAAASSLMFALAAAGPASAAHKSRCHHHAHHACAKSKHASRARVLTFGASSRATGLAGSGAAPTAPGAPSETAGTVASFTDGVLTITLKDGSTVSGMVTDASEIRCRPATGPSEGDDENQNGDESSGGNGDDGALPSGPGIGSHGDDMSGGSDGENGEEAHSSICTTAALTPGATVAEAELSIGASGAVWDRVELVS